MATSPVRLVVSAGERSGDHRGGALITALKDLVPGLELKGLGGDRLAACGLDSEAPLDSLAVMGFVEIITHIPFFFSLLRRMTRVLTEWQPDRLLLVDYPGFNLRLARRAADVGIPVTYYISPQVWAWGRGRIRLLRNTVDQMLVLFDFEKELFDCEGVDTELVGHPLVDEVRPTMGREMFRSQFDLGDTSLVALFPGSRYQEIRAHLPTLHAATTSMSRVTPVVGLAPGISRDVVPDGLRWTPLTYDLLAHADVAVLASGTVTLEAAILGTPMVVVYRTSPLSAFLARRMLTIPYVAMVNVVAGKQVVRECLQQEFTPAHVAVEVQRLLRDEPARRQMKQDLAYVASRLGGPGASHRAAQALARRLTR